MSGGPGFPSVSGDSWPETRLRTFESLSRREDDSPESCNPHRKVTLSTSLPWTPVTVHR